jgi:hypothetical protein
VRLKLGIGTLLLAVFGSPIVRADVDPSFTVIFTGTGYVPSAAIFSAEAYFFVLRGPSPAEGVAPGDPIVACVYGYDGCNAAPPGAYPCLAGLSGLVADLDYLLGSCSSTPPDFGTWTLSMTPLPFLETDDIGLTLGNFDMVTDEPSIPMWPAIFGTGEWTIVQEPASFILLSTTLLAVAFVACKRIARGL